MCRHLVGDDAEAAHVRLLTGHGLEFDMCCPACGEAVAEGRPVELLIACDGCVARCADSDGHLRAWRGTPGIAERPGPLDPTVRETPLPVDAVDFAPVDAADSVWLLLDRDGWIGRFAADTRDWTVLARSTVPAEPEHEPWAGHELRRRLHTYGDGRFAAVVNDFGRHGQVLDLRTGAVTLTLDGGDHRPDTVPFSLAMFERNDRTLVIHRSDWNRLDVSDAATGELLTARAAEPYRQSEPLPEHYLDYFHGGLALSPGGELLLDDGWVWSPFGVPCVWSVDRWLDVNIWESEDGPSLLGLAQRDYYWNRPMCWLDDRRVALSGIGSDERAMLAGIRVFDAVTGRQVSAFAGPDGELFADGTRLYAAGAAGLEVWDPVTGERTGVVPGFAPTRHHRGTGELACLGGSVLRRWRTAGAA
ncbi:WD40 repeat domain-containing protein [Catellatospora vulcania]|uniref:hypothetical protein n=1 Tax=Catellatospora vulcania TaxID=1460450 RepID=UPI001E3C470B|nr:hypothetical protein [Catellatospora vulcania]